MVRIALAIFIGMLTTSGVVAQDRFALVIGNSAYETIAPLEYPAKDATLVADHLETLGFDVTVILDADLVQMKRSIGRYGIRIQEASEGSTGLIYYAGHGVNAFSDNFLLPVDVSVETAEDLDFVAIDVDSLAFESEANQIQNLIILDCCTKNPLAGVPDMGGNGLFPTTVGDGNFIAYSTPANGTIAAGNAAFTRTFIDAISVPGQSIETAIDAVSVVLVAEYGDTQALFRSSSLTDPFVFVPQLVLSDEEKAWLAVQDNSDISATMLFIEEYPAGEFSNDAKRLLLGLLSADLEPLPEDAGGEALGQVEEITPETVIAEPNETESALPSDLNIARVVRYTEPLSEGSVDILGQSIEQLITGKPLFPPIEHLPEVVWKDKNCSDCHQWTEVDLCTQAKFYMSDAGAANLTKEHPYGGTFKENLLVWAQGDCQQ